jgi:hypothetical protein
VNDLVVTRHRAYMEVKEAPDHILISLAAIAILDHDMAFMHGPTLIINCGPPWSNGATVMYRIDGWDADACALTAHKTLDTRPGQEHSNGAGETTEASS